MKHARFFLLASVCLTMTASVDAQDQVNVVTLSPLVGSSINREESQRFRLFTRFPDFDSALVCRMEEERYLVYIVTRSPNGKTADTALAYSENLVQRLAEKINHIDEMTAGTYVPGTDLRDLVSTPLSDPQLSRRISSLWTGIRKTGNAQIPPPQIETAHPWDLPGKKSLPPYDLLPFAGLSDSLSVASFPQFGFGIGLASYSSDFSGLESAIRAMEDYYRAKGFPISSHPPSMDVSLGWLASLAVQFSREFSVQFDLGGALGTGLDKFEVVSGSLLYHFRPARFVAIHPYVAAGVTRFHFEVEKRYGDRISQIDTRGGYYVLESVKSSGAGYGYPLTAGFEYTSPARFAVRLYSTYVLGSSVTAPAGSPVNPSVSFNGLTFGARLLIYP